MNQLRPCPACKRHVRSRETGCPFCGVALTPGPAALPGNPFRGRMSRAAILAAGASLMIAGAACDSDPPKNGDAGHDSAAVSDSAGGGDAATGDGSSADETNTADVGNTTDSAANDRGIVALYGVVAPAIPPAARNMSDNG